MLHVAQPTPDRIRTVLKKAGLTQDQAALELGISLSALKKNLARGTDHRDMSMPAWQLLLLLADEHPRWRLVER